MQILDIPGLVGMYAVSDDGRVWSHKSRKWLKPSLSRGYPMVNLTVENPSGLRTGIRGSKTGRRAKQKVFRIHRLMHKASFPCQNGVINHKDGDKTNNHLSNLEVVSSSQNNRHAYATGLKVPAPLSSERARAMRKAQITGNYSNP